MNDEGTALILIVVSVLVLAKFWEFVWSSFSVVEIVVGVLAVIGVILTIAYLELNRFD